jgi:phosphatidylinositol alpha-mannosyltransferase
MKIAVVCPYDLSSVGGVQTVAVDLVSRLRSGGDEAILVGPGVEPGMGVDIGRSVTVPGNGSYAPIAIGPGVRSNVRRAVGDSDVVHVHEPMMPMVSLAALGAGKPCVATFHAAAAPWTAALYRRFESVGSRLLRGAVITAVSPMAMAGLPDSWSPVTIVPNGIDVASFRLDVRREPGRIAMLGRDEPRKGLDVMLAALPSIRSTHPDVELHVIGAERAPIEGVVFHGRVRDREKRELLASAQVYVAPHLGGESFGIVLAEAMAAGCAVVASDLAAFRAVGGDGVSYFETANSSALASEVSRLITDQEARAELSGAGALRVQGFDWSTVVDRYRELYDRASSIGN